METAITALGFDKSGAVLAAAAIDGDLGRWLLTEAVWKRLACDTAARQLSAKERSKFNVPYEVVPCKPVEQQQLAQ